MLIDPGHPTNQGDPGALGACGYNEVDINDHYGQDLYEDMNNDLDHIWIPYISKLGQNALSLAARVDMANNTSNNQVDAYGDEIPSGGVDAFLSIHSNGSPNQNIHHTETYIYNYNGSDQLEKDRKYVSRNLASMTSVIFVNFTRRAYDEARSDALGIKEADFQVLHYTHMPAILVEMEFVTHQNTNCIMANYGFYNGPYQNEAVNALLTSTRCWDPAYYTEYIATVINNENELNFGAYWTYQCVLVKNNNAGNDGGQRRYFYVDPGTLTITTGAVVVLEPDVWIQSRNTGFIYCFGGIVCLGTDAELGCDFGGIAEINGTNILLGGGNSGSCLTAMGGGTLKLKQPQTLYNGFIFVDSGSTLRIESNSSVLFKHASFLKANPGARIEVATSSLTFENGTHAEAIGTAAQPIVFTSADGFANRRDWGTIFLYGSNNTFEYCTIEGSDWGLKFVGPASGNVVRNCTFRQNDQAIRIHYNDAEVRDCLIENNRHAFVLIDNPSQYGNIYLDGNTVRNNDRDGIYSANSVVDVFRTVLDNNGLGNVSTYHGIWATYSSDIALGSRIWDDDLSFTGGYNTIKNNHGAGVYIATSSLALLGDFINNTFRAGNNSIHNNGTYSGTYNGKEVYNLTATTVQANKNYWGGTPAPSQFYGPVDYNNWLTSPPSGTSIVGLPPGDGSSSSADGIRRSLAFAMSLGTGSALAKNDGTQLSGSDEDDTRIKKEMIRNLRALIAQSPGSPEAVSALMTIFSFIRTGWNDKLGERNGIYGYLDGLYQAHGQLEIGKRALHLMCLERLGRNNFAEAIGLAQTATAKFSGPLRQESMSLLIRLLLRTGQMAQAQQLFDAYKTDYPDDLVMHELLQGMFDHAEHDFAHGAPVNGGLPRPALNEAITQTNTPRELSLVQNFPNPFNPATTIHYALPQAGKVTLRIFNVLGEQVRVLVDEHKPAGQYTEVWDGKNSQGKTASSGICFYQISYLSSAPSAQTIVRSAKMSLLR